jgi:hypothetical protein
MQFVFVVPKQYSVATFSHNLLVNLNLRTLVCYFGAWNCVKQVRWKVKTDYMDYRKRRIFETPLGMLLQISSGWCK